MRKPPAFQFYADDFLAGTAGMTAEEVGAYIRLLCYQWSNGSIPAGADRCAMISGMAQSSLSHVLAKFKIMAGGKLCNERLEHEREKQAAYRQERAESGKKGAVSRWGNGSAIASDIAQPMAQGMAKNGSPSPSPTPTPTPTKHTTEAVHKNGDASGLTGSRNGHAVAPTKPKWTEAELQIIQATDRLIQARAKAKDDDIAY